jgi:hypothetical protein
VFRKIISQLPFSATLIVELSEYAKKIHREKKLRLIGLIAVVLLVLLQIIITVYPPNSNKIVIKSDKELIPSLNLTEYSTNISSVNLSQGGVDATRSAAHPNDKITYSLSITNNANSPIIAPFAISVRDLLEYATLTDLHDGSIDNDSTILYWDPIEIQPGETVLRSFSASINNPLSAAPRVDQESYNCSIDLDFADNKNSVDLQCPLIKHVESIMTSLPRTENTSGLWLGVALLAVTSYLFTRSKQLRREIKLVRRNLNTGGSL